MFDAISLVLWRTKNAINKIVLPLRFHKIAERAVENKPKLSIIEQKR